MNLFDKTFTIIGPVIIIFAVLYVSEKILTDKSSPSAHEVSQQRESAELDITRPVYTASHAIICPLSIIADKRVDHGAAAVGELYTSIFNVEEKAQKLGCELWNEGIKLSKRIYRDGGLVIFTLPNETTPYFAPSYYLRN